MVHVKPERWRGAIGMESMRRLCPAGREAGSKCPRLSRITLPITGSGVSMFHLKTAASPTPVHRMVIRHFGVLIDEQ